MTVLEFNKCLSEIRKGNINGIVPIYKHYYEKMVFTAERETGCRSKAEDIASGVILTIIEKAQNYKHIGNPNAWIYRSVKNATINHIKKDVRWVYTDFAEEQHAEKDKKIDFKLELKRAIEGLTERQKDIVELHYIYGLKYSKISKIKNISVSTIKREIIIIKEKLSYLKNF